MRKRELKHNLILITYSAVLLLVMIYFKDISNGIRKIMELLSSFFIGIAIAFVLKNPCEKFYLLYRKCRIREKLAHALGVVSSYMLVIVLIGAVIIVVIPQLMKNIQMFLLSLPMYIREIQAGLDVLTERLKIDTVDISKLLQGVEMSVGKVSDIADKVIPHIAVGTMNAISSIATFCVGIGFSVYLLGGRKWILNQFNRMVKAVLPERVYFNIKAIG